MFKQILIIFLTVLVVNSQINNSSLRIDDYINSNRRRHAAIIDDYDFQIQSFREQYSIRIATIDVQRDMLEDSLIQSDARLNPFRVLSDFTKQCVDKYDSLILTVASVRTTINACIATATNQITSLLSYPLSTRNTLQSYYTVNFERDLTNCNKTHVNSVFNYTLCVTNVCATTNTYTANNQKTFATQLDASQCTAKANIKKALDCSFSAQNRTISLTAQANTLINRCFQGLDDCSRCSQSNYCSDLTYLPKYQVSFSNSTMVNVFNGRNQTSDCLMVKLY